MQVDCIGGCRTPQGEALSGSSGSGVLLFGVMKSRKQNTELPLNASDQNKSPHRHHKKRDKNFSFLFGTKILSSDKYPKLHTSF